MVCHPLPDVRQALRQLLVEKGSFRKRLSVVPRAGAWQAAVSRKQPMRVKGAASHTSGLMSPSRALLQLAIVPFETSILPLLFHDQVTTS